MVFRTFQKNALIVLDIDHFKEVNDTYGHLVGNELLIALAKYLLFHTNPNDIVIRMGGDEFVVFLKNVHDDLTYPCNQLMSHLNEISLSHHGIHFSISMGVYTFSNEQNFDNIFKNLETMMVLTIYRRQLCGGSMKSYPKLYEYADVIQLSVCMSVFPQVSDVQFYSQYSII